MSKTATVRKTLPPLNPKRPALRRLRAQLAKVIHAFFLAQVPRIVAQLHQERARMGKSDLSADEEAAVEAILAELDFSGWSVLVGDVQPVLDAIFSEGSTAAVAQIGLGTEARSEVLNVVRQESLDYARARAAELVGMRYDKDTGDLIENPNAEWRIDEPTRDFIRSDVGDAIAEGWSNDTLAAKLAENYGFSEARSMTIARTETQFAANRGALASYVQSGVVDGKQWLTADDDLVDTEECEPNGEAGPDGDGVLSDLLAEYPSGDVAPPAHPNAVLAGSTFAPYGRLEEMVRADYRGPAILITTAQAKYLAIGPNHPVLTRRGMIKARSLAKGDDLVYDLRCDDAAFSAKADLDQMPFVEDAFETLLSGGCLSRIAAAGYDLHGDRAFCHGEIDVVETADSLLPVLDSCGVEHAREFGFARSDMQPVTPTGDGASGLDFDTVDLPATRGISGGLPRHFVFLKVQSIHYADWHGKAFDATTSTGIYNSGGFVVSNCRCALAPVVIFQSEPEQE